MLSSISSILPPAVREFYPYLAGGVFFGLSVAITALAIVALALVLQLLSFHIYLITHGLTTYDYIVNRASGASQPSRASVKRASRGRSTRHSTGSPSRAAGGSPARSSHGDSAAAAAPAGEAAAAAAAAVAAGGASAHGISTAAGGESNADVTGFVIPSQSERAIEAGEVSAAQNRDVSVTVTGDAAPADVENVAVQIEPSGTVPVTDLTTELPPPETKEAPADRGAAEVV